MKKQIIFVFIFILVIGCSKKSEEPRKTALDWSKKETQLAKKKVEGPTQSKPDVLKMEVTVVQGDVEIEIEEQKKSALPGTSLSKGTKIKTRPQSQTDIKTNDNSMRLRIKENSDAVGGSFAFLDEKREGALDLDKGTLFLELAKNQYDSFTIRTESAEIIATGTAFCVEVFGDQGNTWVGVVEGEVLVRNLITSAETSLGVDEAVELNVLQGRADVMYLSEEESGLIRQEIRRIGTGYAEDLEPKVELLLPKNKHRLRTLFRSAAVATNGREPLSVHRLLMDSLKLMEDGVVEEEKKFLLASIEKLESALLYYNDVRYAPQLLMFIGVYYHNLREYEKAIEAFDNVVRLYPNNKWDSLAYAAMAMTYEEDLKEYQKAEETYRLILEKYPESFEIQVAVDGLDRIRVRQYE